MLYMFKNSILTLNYPVTQNLVSKQQNKEIRQKIIYVKKKDIIEHTYLIYIHDYIYRDVRLCVVRHTYIVCIDRSCQMSSMQ